MLRIDAHECATVLGLRCLNDLVKCYPAVNIRACDDSFYL